VGLALSSKLPPEKGISDTISQCASAGLLAESLNASEAGGKTETAQNSSSAQLRAVNKLLPNDETCDEEQTEASNIRIAHVNSSAGLLAENRVLTNDAPCAEEHTKASTTCNAHVQYSAEHLAENRYLSNNASCAEEQTIAPNTRKSTNPEMITTRSPHGTE
jgi:hypothetical protein